MRTLATIRKVSYLEPIENADRIEVCNLNGLGWKVIVKKNEVKSGDKVVFFEIDSALPTNDERYEFLRESSYKRWMAKDKVLKDCFRLKTRKLRGVVSQGLILPISMFKELAECNVGDDVTEKLHIEHYDELNDLYGKCNSSGGGHTSIGNAKGSFPTFCKKSDQTRIQNLMNYFDDCKDIKFTAEAKYDGSSCTVYMVDKKYDKDQFGVCSRNFNLKRPNTTKLQFIKECLFYHSYPHNPIKRLIDRFKRTLRALKSDYKSCTHSDYWKVVNNVGLEENMRNYFNKYKRSIAIQGEMVGPGINSNRDKYEEHHLFVFDIYDVDNQKYLDSKERHEIISEMNKLGNAKIEEVDTIKDEWFVFRDLTNLEEMLKFVDRKTLRNNPLEGVVFKSIGCNPYFSFKCINNKYLLAEKD